MADSGSAGALIGGDGYYYSLWVIARIDDTSSLFAEAGAAKRIESSLKLNKVDDDRTDLLGSLVSGVASWLSF